MSPLAGTIATSQSIPLQSPFKLPAKTETPTPLVPQTASLQAIPQASSGIHTVGRSTTPTCPSHRRATPYSYSVKEVLALPQHPGTSNRTANSGLHSIPLRRTPLCRAVCHSPHFLSLPDEIMFPRLAMCWLWRRSRAVQNSSRLYRTVNHPPYYLSLRVHHATQSLGLGAPFLFFLFRRVDPLGISQTFRMDLHWTWHISTKVDYVPHFYAASFYIWPRVSRHTFLPRSWYNVLSLPISSWLQCLTFHRPSYLAVLSCCNGRILST